MLPSSPLVSIDPALTPDGVAVRDGDTVCVIIAARVAGCLRARLAALLTSRLHSARSATVVPTGATADALAARSALIPAQRADEPGAVDVAERPTVRE